MQAADKIPKYASLWKERLVEEYWKKRNFIKQSPKASSSFLRRLKSKGQTHDYDELQ